MIHYDPRLISQARDLSRRQVLAWAGAFVATIAQGSAASSASAQPAKAVARNTKGERVVITAKPASIAIDLAATAVIVVDMQNDFASKGGMLDRLGENLAPIQHAVEPIARVIRAGRRSGMKIIYLKMAMKPDLSDMGPVDSPNWIAHHNAGVGTKMRAPDGSEGRILIRDTWNTAVIDAAKPETGDIQIYKHRYSGFFETDLDETLKHLGVRYLIVTGCTTSVCVESTIRDATFRDYSPVLLADCASEPLGNDLPRSNHDASIFLIAERNFGWVSTSNDFIKALEASAT